MLAHSQVLLALPFSALLFCSFPLILFECGHSSNGGSKYIKLILANRFGIHGRLAYFNVLVIKLKGESVSVLTKETKRNCYYLLLLSTAENTNKENATFAIAIAQTLFVLCAKCKSFPSKNTILMGIYGGLFNYHWMRLRTILIWKTNRNLTDSPFGKLKFKSLNKQAAEQT